MVHIMVSFPIPAGHAACSTCKSLQNKHCTRSTSCAMCPWQAANTSAMRFYESSGFAIVKEETPDQAHHRCEFYWRSMCHVCGNAEFFCDCHKSCLTPVSRTTTTDANSADPMPAGAIAWTAYQAAAALSSSLTSV